MDRLITILGQFYQKMDCDQSRKEPGNWPTKTIINMWQKNVKEELNKVYWKIREQEVTD